MAATLATEQAPPPAIKPASKPAAIARRALVATLGAGIATASAVTKAAASASSSAASSQAASSQAAAGLTAPAGMRRRLGPLEVSSVGFGVQNMHRTYQTTVPYRPEMLRIIRAAHDEGITFFDTAEAYGPFENERILG